jgi:hypothetical protein
MYECMIKPALCLPFSIIPCCLSLKYISMEVSKSCGWLCVRLMLRYVMRCNVSNENQLFTLVQRVFYRARLRRTVAYSNLHVMQWRESTKSWIICAHRVCNRFKIRYSIRVRTFIWCTHSYLIERPSYIDPTTNF